MSYKAIVYSDNGFPVRVRKQPSTDADIADKLMCDTVVEVLEDCNTDWKKIQFKDDEVGYMMSKFLKREDGNNTVTKADLQRVYDSLQEALNTIDTILKK